MSLEAAFLLAVACFAGGMLVYHLVLARRDK